MLNLIAWTRRENHRTPYIYLFYLHHLSYNNNHIAIKMPNPPFPNVYTHRKVADTSSKPCDICYKASTSVLVVPDNKVRKEDI